MRPFKINTYAIDRDSVERKSKEMTDQIISSFSERIDNRIMAMRMQQQMIAQKQELIAQQEEIPGSEEMIMQLKYDARKDARGNSIRA